MFRLIDGFSIQVKLSVHLALGRVGLCVRSPEVGPSTCLCSGGFGEGSSLVILGQSQTGNCSLLHCHLWFVVWLWSVLENHKRVWSMEVSL